MDFPLDKVALYYEPDGYDVGKAALVGRQVASHGFLRAAVQARGEAALTGFGPPHLGPKFAELVRAMDPAAETQWIPLDFLEQLARRGVCHRPDPQLGREARLRLRVGPQSYALTGTVHTTATVLDQLASLLREPLTPWDALICPTNAVAESISRVQDAEADYLRWKFGAEAPVVRPQLPVIPLGVHCADFVFTPQERATARAQLGLAEGDVMALFVGRLSFLTKAHPLPMYLGLQAAAERTGRKITLAQCGWASQAPLQAAMEAGAAQFCPSVRSLFVDGRDAANRRRCWAAADIFVSLSDNVQETFGLTPVEAMAAGLPCVVTDWNGYKETVRDGVDGFRIATWAPPPGAGDALSRAREAETLIMDLACWAQAASTSVDLGQLADRLVTLVENEDLRKQMGAAGAARAKSVFDWPVVFAQHQALWGELDARRLAATGDELAALSGAPKVSAGGDDFFRTFGHYPTHALGPETQVKLASGASWERYKAISANPLFPMDPAPERNAQPLWRALEGGELSLAQACAAAGLPMRTVLLTVGTLAKMGLVELSQ